jgi:hypothetical protein
VASKGKWERSPQGKGWRRDTGRKKDGKLVYEYSSKKPTSKKKWDYDRDAENPVPKGGGPDQRLMRQIDKVVKRVKHSMSPAQWIKYFTGKTPDQMLDKALDGKDIDRFLTDKLDNVRGKLSPRQVMKKLFASDVKIAQELTGIAQELMDEESRTAAKSSVRMKMRGKDLAVAKLLTGGRLDAVMPMMGGRVQCKLMTDVKRKPAQIYVQVHWQALDDTVSQREVKDAAIRMIYPFIDDVKKAVRAMGMSVVEQSRVQTFDNVTAGMDFKIAPTQDMYDIKDILVDVFKRVRG